RGHGRRAPARPGGRPGAARPDPGQRRRGAAGRPDGPADRLAVGVRRGRGDRRRLPGGAPAGPPRAAPPGADPGPRRAPGVPPPPGAAGLRRGGVRLRRQLRGLRLHQPDADRGHRAAGDGRHPGAGAVRSRHDGGAIAGGRLADRAPMPTLWLFTAALAVLLALFTVTVASPILAPVTFFLIGATGFIAVTSLQTMILDRAKEAPGLAAAGIHSAFNIANAMGATLGGAAISAGFGLASPSMVGALLSAVGLGLALLMGMPARRAAVVPD